MLQEFNGKRVIVMACSDCNIRCKHWYISYKGSFSGKELYELISNLIDIYKILINGTEPLIHKEFLPSYKLAGYKSPITNGLVFKDNLNYLDELKENGINEIRILTILIFMTKFRK